MSTAGRCIARSTSSGNVVGPGMARNSRPARTTILPRQRLRTRVSLYGGREFVVKRDSGLRPIAAARPTPFPPRCLRLMKTITPIVGGFAV
jgi:hypothetical protein